MTFSVIFWQFSTVFLTQMRKGEPLRGSGCFFPETLRQGDDCGPGWGWDPAETLARAREWTPPKSWQNPRARPKLLCRWKLLPPRSSGSGFAGEMASFPEESPFLKFHSRDMLLVITACQRRRLFTPSPWVTSDTGDIPTILLSLQGAGSWEGKMTVFAHGDHSVPPTWWLLWGAWPRDLRTDGIIYYFTGLLLSDKGSQRSSRLASPEHIFNMKCERNNKNMKWLIREPFHKGPAWWQVSWSAWPFANYQVEWNQTPRIQNAELGQRLGGGREERNSWTIHYSLPHC